MSPSPTSKHPKPVHLPYPTDEVAHRTIVRLQSLLIHDAHAEVHLSDIEAEADRYRRSRALLQERIFRCRAVIAPIRRIPVSVLAHIFGFLVITSPDEVAKLGMVCRSWREAAKLPHFWSNIVIAAEDIHAEQKATLFVKNSEKFPLNITYVQSIPDQCQTLSYNVQVPWKAWDTLRSASARWKKLSIDFFDCKDASCRIRNLGHAPRLEELRILVRQPCALSSDEGKFGLETVVRWDGRDSFSQSVPLLKKLYLETFILPRAPGNIFKQLTKLHIHDTFARLKGQPKNNLMPINAVNVLTLLTSCPNLEDFSFDAEEMYPWYVRANDTRPVFGPMILLPRLLRFHINCHFHTGQEIFGHLTTEMLGFASLKLRPRHALKDTSLTIPTGKFIRRSQQLRSLHVLGLNQGILDAGPLRHLEELHLEFCPDLEPILARLDEGPLCYAPRLSKIIIDADPCDIPDESLATLVKRRFLASRRRGGVSAIEKLVLNGRDMLAGVEPGAVAKFERKERFSNFNPRR